MNKCNLEMLSIDQTVQMSIINIIVVIRVINLIVKQIQLNIEENINMTLKKRVLIGD